MTSHVDRSADDREILLARVDELTTIVAALVRAMEETRSGVPEASTAGLTQESIVAFLSSVESDLAYLRGMADVYQHRASTAEASLAGAQDELAGLLGQVVAAEAAATQWADECGRLRDARDDLVQEVQALQGGRWMRLGRTLGVGRRTGRA